MERFKLSKEEARKRHNACQRRYTKTPQGRINKRLQNRRWRTKNKKHIRDYYRKWRKKNPNYNKNYLRTYRRKK